MDEKKYINYKISELYSQLDIIEKSLYENEIIMKLLQEKIDKKLYFLLSKDQFVNDAYKKYRDNVVKCYDNSIHFIFGWDIVIKSETKITELRLELYKKIIERASSYLKKEELDAFNCVCEYSFLERYYSLDNKEQRDLSEQEETISSWKKKFYYKWSTKKIDKAKNELLKQYYGISTDNKLLIQEGEYPAISDFFLQNFQYNLARNIFYGRKRKHLTQLQLESRSGVDRTMIAKVEKMKKKASLETAIKLLSSLGLGLSIVPNEEIGG